jgi:tetratricopeptide (TPR) repeat protein
VYYKKDDLEKAKDYYERALEIREEQLGPNHVDVAKSYNALGILCNDAGDLGKAKDYHERALEIRKEQ